MTGASDVLVSPKRVVKRFADMTSEEVKDLFIATHQIVPVMERHYHGTATNIAIQDGKEAGQSVEVRVCVCVHARACVHMFVCMFMRVFVFLWVFYNPDIYYVYSREWHF